MAITGNPSALIGFYVKTDIPISGYTAPRLDQPQIASFNPGDDIGIVVNIVSTDIQWFMVRQSTDLTSPTYFVPFMPDSMTVDVQGTVTANAWASLPGTGGQPTLPGQPKLNIPSPPGTNSWDEFWQKVQSALATTEGILIAGVVGFVLWETKGLWGGWTMKARR
jgi:hypothetical protein